MNFKKFAILPLVSLMFAACSDSSSTSAEQAPVDPTLSSSSEVIDPALSSSDVLDPTLSSSSEVIDPALSSSELPPEISSSSVDIPYAVIPGIPLTEADYDSVGVVPLVRALQSVSSDEKVVIVLRHAERESGSGHETPLTDNGTLQAQLVGASLPASMTFTYSHTDYLRTEQTALNIALGHGQDITTLAHDTILEVKGGWFVKDADLKDSYATKDTNSYGVLSLWVYEGLFADAFYDLNEKAQEMVNTVLVKNYADMEPARIIISHDDFVVPMMAAISDKKADFRYKRARYWWCNYLVGFVVVVNSNNEVRAIPVKGLESAVEG